MSSNLPVSGPAPGEQAAGCDAPVLLQACESTGLTACTHTPTASPGPTCESDVPVRHHHRVDLKMNNKRQETRFSAIKKMRGLKSNWEDRMSLKSRRQQVKEAEEERKTAKSLALQVSFLSFESCLLNHDAWQIV